MSDALPNTVLFLAQTRDTPSIAEQRQACAAKGDIVVDAGQVSFADLPKQLARQGHDLVAGDRIKVYDLTCLPMNTMTLIRVIHKLLRKGIAVEFCQPGLVIQPQAIGGDLTRMIAALDHHWRRVHGLKTHTPDAKPGRKKRLADDRLPEIKALLAARGATVASVARDIKVGRSTLFDFLRRHSADTGV